MNKMLIGIAIVLVLGGGAFFLLQNQATAPASQNQEQSQTQTTQQTQPTTSDTFTTPKKSAHYESNTPEHGAVLASVPVNVVINFNFDLAPGSNVLITHLNQELSEGEIIIDPNKLTMRRNVRADSPDGVYTVVYKACWADGSCHDGQFQFKIDRSKVSGFVDMTGKKEVIINMQNFTFNPPMVKVSKGTTVTWINQDLVEHTVNTDSHPAHTYYLLQNSRTLAKGDSYSTTFDKIGIYLYHCTPHADSMKGQILIE